MRYGHRETTRVFQYVRCLSSNPAPAKPPPVGLSHGDPPSGGALRQAPAPTQVGVRGLGAGGSRAIGLAAAFLTLCWQHSWEHTHIRGLSISFRVYCENTRQKPFSATWLAGYWHQSERECDSVSSQSQRREESFSFDFIHLCLKET